ncbi:STAS domain-containing protein [Streptomyces sp. NPDC046939]|uniref:STAS domain-containing protein n=1 Tax=Streptomyces sp. NPDC046939 TaxID=3155376 RepID=UPI003403D758
MAEEDAPFGFRVRTSRGRQVIALRGELDILARQQMSAPLLTLVGEAAGEVYVDLRHMSFIDCAGLSLLCALRNRCRQRRRRLTLVSDDAAFSRLLRLTGLADTFTVVGCREVTETIGAEDDWEAIA